MPGLITSLYDDGWDELGSDLNLAFIAEVKATLGGPEFSADFPPSIGGCVEIDPGGLLSANASEDLADAFQVGLDYEDPSKFEQVFVSGLYDTTLKIIDAIPLGPYPPTFIDPSASIDLSYFDVPCSLLVEFIGCALGIMTTQSYDECMCEFINVDSFEAIHEAALDSGATTEEDTCKYMVSLMLELPDFPWPPSWELDIPWPPDFCELFLPEVECNFELPDISFMFVLTWIIDWFFTFPDFIIDLVWEIQTCIIEGLNDPCALVECIVGSLEESLDIEGLATEMNLPISFIAAIAVYMKHISIYTVQLSIAMMFGAGIVTDCIGDALGL